MGGSQLLVYEGKTRNSTVTVAKVHGMIDRGREYGAHLFLGGLRDWILGSIGEEVESERLVMVDIVGGSIGHHRLVHEQDGGYRVERWS